MSSCRATNANADADGAPPPSFPPRHADIPIDEVVPSPTNPRKRFENLDELSESIARHGVIQAVTVRPAAVGYELIVGERRWRAAKLAGLATIPARIVEMTDEEVEDVQDIENLQRSDLHPLEEAEGYQRRIQARGYSVEQLAARIGKSKGYVYARLKLMALAPAARQPFVDGRLPASIALQLARIPDAKLQTKATEEVLAGRRRIDAEGREVIEPMSLREAQEHLQRLYMLRLDVAPFDAKDAELVPAAGACTTCPHRTGNQRELFADAAKAKDLCTNPPCFASKKAAAWDRRAAEATRAGMRVLTARESKAVFGTGTAVKADAAYIDLKDPLPYELAEETGKKSWTTLLGKNAPPKVLAQDGSGAPRELVEREAAIAAAVKSGKVPEKVVKEREAQERKAAKSSDDWKATQEKEARKRAVQLRVARMALGQLAEEVEAGRQIGGAEWRWMARALVRLVDDEAHRLVVLRREWRTPKPTDAFDANEKVLLAAIPKMPVEAVRALAFELLAAFKAAPSWGKPGEGFGEACELFEVDLPELKKKAEAEQKAEEKAKAAEADTTKKKGGK